MSDLHSIHSNTSCSHSESVFGKHGCEESKAVNSFWQCYGIAVRYCDQVEHALLQGSCSLDSVTTMLDIMRQHQYMFQKASSDIAPTEVSRDLLSLEERTKLRLTRVIKQMENNIPPTPGTYITVDSCYPKSTAGSDRHHSKVIDYRTKDCSQYDHSSPYDSALHDHDAFQRGQQGISHCGIHEHSTATHNCIAHTVTNHEQRTSTMNENVEHVQTQQSYQNTCSSTNSFIKLAQLTQRCDDLAHQISIAKQEAEKRSLEASRERLKQMNLEQDLIKTQREIDELTESNYSMCSATQPVAQLQDFDNIETKHKPNNDLPNRESQNDVDNIAKVFADAINLSKLPVPEPSVFSGDPLEYPAWSSSYHTLIGNKNIQPGEKIHYLRRYLDGEAKECVEGMFLFNTETAYQKALELLDKRFGSDFAISEAFRDKLYSWPKIRKSDSNGIRRFSDFIQQCDLAKCSIKGLECLSDCRENRKMLTKLPDYIIEKWNRIISDYHGYFPPFSQFASFIAKEADIACNPITSLNAVRAIQRKCHDHDVGDGYACADVKTSVPTTQSCRYCHRNSHKLHRCNSFIALKPDDRREFLQKKRLCFGCLEYGHLSKDCTLKKTCRVCKKRHPTCLHGDYEAIFDAKPDERSDLSSADDQESNCSREPSHVNNLQISQNSTHCGMIVPVYISNVRSPNKEILTYALLDTQSEATFVLSKIGNALQTTNFRSTVKLSTLTSTETLNCYEYRDLQVRGYNQDTHIPLPYTFSRGEIPARTSNIPTQSVAKQWPHLKHLSSQIPELLDCEVGLLIGYNCPQALAPRDFVSSEGNVPFAQKTKLGWSIVGITDGRKDHKDSHQNCLSICNLSTGYQIPHKIKSPYKEPAVQKLCNQDAVKRRVTNAIEFPINNVSFCQGLPSTSAMCHSGINLTGQVYGGECKCR